MSKHLHNILHQLKKGQLSVEAAEQMLKSYEDLGFVKVDVHRQRRKGFPEVIYGEGKTAEQILKIIKSLQETENRILVTRVSEDKGQKVINEQSEIVWDSTSKTLVWKRENEPEILYDGYVSVLCAGTSDLAVAEEAAVSLEAMGVRPMRFYDVGVAGIHRLFDQLDEIKKASVIIAIAGMEGALPSVVGGLVDKPVLAVPTSVGYGANLNGISSLLTMLNSCSSGISVVNIDNGFGAAYQAALIHRLVYQKSN
ncbi:nickel pincer cofactor biosynthesis protein LarB [Bacillus alveayuensis]|jgi:pyridinium-3,5-biscarboxylic acid mononucleotide synthase|uniref:nickel pincer cofactor biosynthesis protein LarB n=1 Tax=Aeribacillus alveayuensis TaxID=279215 RepID=UPI0005D0FC14|nr:nickel pincer cofactor biosynthesis protein LarB [Bacillus alveayuensis]